MSSSQDLESFYFQYQTEALPHGESLQAFRVSYHIFQKWYKDTRNKIVGVKVDGIPTDGDPNTSNQHVSKSSKDNPVRIKRMFKGVDL